MRLVLETAGQALDLGALGVGVVTFAFFVAALLFVRGIGGSRPHS